MIDDAPAGRAVSALGLVQCAYWGVLYYAFGVLLLPMQRELGASASAVAGAFSTGLVASAVLAVPVGRALDRGRAAAFLRAGALAGAPLLWLWSCVDTLPMLYAVWAGLGACMALVLYEPAFALVTRAHDDAGWRLRAIARVSVLGGLASTAFVPLTAYATAALGWRDGVRVLVLAWLAAALLVERVVAPGLRDRAACATAVAANAAGTVPDRVRVALLATPFVAGTLAAGALTALLVATLVARGHGIERAAWVLACFGLLQLPGRIWLARGRGAAAPSALVVVPGLLEAAGLAVFAFAQTLPGAFVGVALFALGAGMHTLARPWLVPALFGVAASGRVNGSIARAQGYARAAAPFAGAAAIDAWGAPSAFVALAALLLLALPFGRAGLAGARA